MFLSQDSETGLNVKNKNKTITRKEKWAKRCTSGDWKHLINEKGEGILYETYLICYHLALPPQKRNCF